MDGPGTMTWEEFVKDAKNFVGLSDEISDNWELHGDEDLPAQAFLRRQTRTFIQATTIPADERRTEFKDPFEAETDPDIPLIVEHHVLWSLSYGVPLLLFNGWLSDFPGINPVSVETAQKLAVHHGASLGYSELSQTIHPILGTTFLELHPCMSKELLQNTSKSNNKLVSWLSSVAPAALNLNIKNDYFRLTRAQEFAKEGSSHIANQQ